MRSINKLVCLALFPAVAFTTSCSTYGKKVSFVDAYNHVLNNYDKHEFDYVDADYSANLKTFTLNGHSDKVTVDGKDNHQYNHNFGGMKFDFKNLFGICLTTEALSTVQQYYTTYAGVTLNTLTGINVDLSYYVKSGELSIVLSTKTINKIADLLTSAYSLIQTIPFLKKMIITISEKMKMEFIGTLINSLTISQESTGNGYFEVAVRTDNCGFLKSASVKSKIDYNIGAGIFKTVEDESTKKEEKVFESYTNTVGSLNIDLNVSASFKN